MTWKRPETEYEQKNSPFEGREDEFKYIFETANVGKSITSLDGTGKINKALAAMLGYTREELTGRTWQDLTLPEDVDVTQRNLNSLLSGEKNGYPL